MQWFDNSMISVVEKTQQSQTTGPYLAKSPLHLEVLPHRTYPVLQTPGPAGHSLIACVLPIISGLGVALARSSASWCFHVTVGSSIPKYDGSAHKEPFQAGRRPCANTSHHVGAAQYLCGQAPVVTSHQVAFLACPGYSFMERRKVWKIKNMHIFRRGVREVIAFVKLDDMIRENKQTRNLFRFMMFLPRNPVLLISFSSPQLHHYITCLNY